MTDPLAAGAEPEVAPVAPEPPALTAAQIEAMVERKAQEISDRRVAGLMSKYDREIATMKAEQVKFRKSFSGEDDDTPDPRLADLEAEVARLNSERELAELRVKYPDVIEDYIALSGAENRAGQLAALDGLRQRLTAPPPSEEPAAEPEIPTPPVHPNQPARPPRGWVPGTAMDPQTADAFFKGLTEWPT